MSENYTHWIGIVPTEPLRAKMSPRGAAVAVIDTHGHLKALVTVRAPYSEETTEGIETLSMLVNGDWEGLRGADWRPLVVLDRFSARTPRSTKASHPMRVFTSGLLIGFLGARAIEHVALPRKLWVDAALAGVRHPERGETREAARLKAAAERWSRFSAAREADQFYAEAALLADVGRQRFRSSEAVA